MQVGDSVPPGLAALSEAKIFTRAFLPTEGPLSLDAVGLPRTHEGHCGVESDFAFLKDPLVVNDLFEKTPSRIDALGMVLNIALMVWRLVERTMRAFVENAKEKLPGGDHKYTSNLRTSR